MAENFTLNDIELIFGKNFIPADIDTKILMKHFQIGVNRIIGEKTVDKIKAVLIHAIEVTRAEQTKDIGGVINSPLERLKQKTTSTDYNNDINSTIEKKQVMNSKDTEDKYGLSSLRTGLVSQRLQERKEITQKDKQKQVQNEQMIETHEKEQSILPSVEDLTILSGGNLNRDGENNTPQVQREIAIRDYQIQDESRSIRWGIEFVKNREGKNQEINNPSYIFHTDLWQFEESREKNTLNRCDILQHVVLDMLANNINVVMLDNETEPFFIVEGHGLLHSKDTLKDKIKIEEPIHLVIISSEAWQIALKKPESLIRGRDLSGMERIHSIDMTSVIPLANIRSRIVEFDSKFKSEYQNPDFLIKQAIREIEKHRKNVIWSCGASAISIIREAVIKHRSLIENPINSLNLVIIGTNQAIHPMKIKFNLSGELEIEELFPEYCKKHSILSLNAMNNIFGSIPAIYDSEAMPSDNEIIKIAYAVYNRLGYSALETTFDPGYIKGNPSEIMPLSKMDIIIPPSTQELQQKLLRKGFNID